MAEHPTELPAPGRRQRWREKRNRHHEVLILYLSDREQTPGVWARAALCAVFVDGARLIHSRWILCSHFEPPKNRFVYIGVDAPAPTEGTDK